MNEQYNLFVKIVVACLKKFNLNNLSLLSPHMARMLLADSLNSNSAAIKSDQANLDKTFS